MAECRKQDIPPQTYMFFARVTEGFHKDVRPFCMKAQSFYELKNVKKQAQQGETKKKHKMQPAKS